MLSFRSFLRFGLVCLAVATAQAEVPLLRPDENSSRALLSEDWVLQSPVPTARNLWGAAWATPTHAFAVGDGLTMIETFDAGATWRNVELSSSPGPLYNVKCLDANICVAIGNSATTGRDIYRTTNAGATWQRLTNFPLGGSWDHLDFVSPTVGFMGANGAAARTTDAGATWTLRSGFPSCPVMYGMDFRDASVGLCGGERVSGSDSGPGIFKTTDAGMTWVRKFSQSANDVLWLNDTTAIASVGASIYRSTNSGDTWSQISSQVFTGLDEMTLLPNGTIVGVSFAGDGWRSTDGGVNWTRTLTGSGALPANWGVAFSDNLLGMLVGQGGYILKTTDGGLTWTVLNSGIGGVEFHDLEMFDDNTGLAVGDSGYFLRTTNGGSYWAPGRLQVTGQILFRDENLQALSIVDQDFAVAAGNNGVVYKTFDRGATWQSIGYPLLPTDYLISDVKFITREIGYVAGTLPQVAILPYVTTNGGASWTALDSFPAHFIDFVDPSHGWLVTIGASGFRTTNGGGTWQPMTLPNNGGNAIISEIDFASQNVGWAVGWFGYAARTSNGGVNWTLQNISSPEEIFLGLRAVSETEAYAVGIHQQPTSETASVFHTVDSGATWTREFVPADYLNNIFANSSGNLWASGYDGKVLHKAGAGSTLQLVSALSRKTHRSAGTFDVNLPLTGTPGLECRDGGGTYTFVFNFTTNVVGGTASVVLGTGSAGTPSFSGTTMTVPLTGVTDVQMITVKLSGVTDSSNNVLPDTLVSANMLIGDVNGDKTVNSVDVSLTRGQVGMPVTSANFRDDVRISGTIDSRDVREVRGANGHSLP